MEASPAVANFDHHIEFPKRKGDWFLTYTGRQFWPLDPRAEDVCIRDIAHHLSLICRFNGACRAHYSVAQHSVMVADILPPPLKFYGLLHDATEAYVGDMVRPLKRSMPEYQQVENLVWLAIVEKFKIMKPVDYAYTPPEQAGSVEILDADGHVKLADNIALMTERRDLLVKSPKAWSTQAEPLPTCIRPLAARDAEIQFLEMFDELEGLR